MSARADRPVLWQLEISHYNEKVRWALDYKRIDHVRRSLLPGAHILVTRRLTNGACETTPVLTLDGRSHGGSAAIVDELERRWPEPALYPDDVEERAEALALAALCDAEIGDHIRRVAYEHLLGDPRALMPAFVHNQPPLARALLRGAFPVLRGGMRRRFQINTEAAAASRAHILAAVDRLEQQLDGGSRDHLIGDRFTIADLTAAALLYPIARPAAFPYPIPALAHGAVPFVDELAARPIGRWVALMYERHRLTPASP